MPDFLKEADWKAVLEKPKNLGLRAQKTGISEKLRLYESAMNAYNSSKTKSNAETALNAVRQLSATAKDQSTKHGAFTEATDYMKNIVIEAGKVEGKLVGAIAMFGLLDIVKAGVKDGETRLSKVDSQAKMTDMNPSSAALQSVRAVGAACGKIPALSKYGQQSKDLTETSAIAKISATNWKDYKAKVQKFFENVKADAAKVV